MQDCLLVALQPPSHSPESASVEEIWKNHAENIREIRSQVVLLV
jgi:hypothetical protein